MEQIMNTSFTPGLWKIEQRTTTGEFVTTTHIVSKNGSHVAIIGPCSITANARLIAAAPELFYALSAMLNRDDLSCYAEPMLRQARSALQKATHPNP